MKFTQIIPFSASEKCVKNVWQLMNILIQRPSSENEVSSQQYRRRIFSIFVNRVLHFDTGKTVTHVHQVLSISLATCHKQLSGTQLTTLGFCQYPQLLPEVIRTKKKKPLEATENGVKPKLSARHALCIYGNGALKRLIVGSRGGLLEQRLFGEEIEDQVYKLYISSTKNTLQLTCK